VNTGIDVMTARLFPGFLLLVFAISATAELCARDKQDPGQAKIQWENLSNDQKMVLAQRARERWAELSPERKDALVRGSIERNLIQ
jgi:hypothetical protein